MIPTKIHDCPNCGDAPEDHPEWFSDITKVFYPENTAGHIRRCPLLRPDVRRSVAVLSAIWASRQ